MIIDAVHVRRKELKRHDPAWRTSSYSASEVVGVYVGIEVGGQVGVGASSAHPRNVTPEDLVAQLTEVVRPALDGQPVEAARARLSTVLARLHARAQIAVDLALHDLHGKLAGLPAEVLWGGPLRDRIQVIRMVGLKDPEEIVATVAPMHAQGFRAFKVKIGETLDRDVERIRRIRAEFDADVMLAVDANGFYGRDEALDLCRQLAELDVRCVEQPLPYDDLEGMAALRAASPIPLMADQLVNTAEDAVRVGQAGAADMVSLKLTKMGSVTECVRVAGICQAMGVGVHLGGSASPTVVDSAITRLALACDSIDPVAEAGESLALVDDQAAGVTFTDGWAASDGRPGLGAESSVFET